MPKDGLSEALQRRMAASSPEQDSIDRDYNAMFGLDKAFGIEKVVELDLDKLKPHPQDPFKPYSDDKLKELAESISSIGLLDPINVRLLDGYIYEILTGKNRVNAARLNGDKKIKAIIRDVDDDMSVIIITDSNLKHREKLLPSEKAWAYKMQLDALKKQGKRDTSAENSTSSQFARKSKAAHFLAERHNISEDEVYRYIRLTNLSQELLMLVDSEKISLMAGVNLSYIPEQAQNEVYKYFFVMEHKRKLDLRISDVIKRADSDGRAITIDTLDKLLQKRAERSKPRTFSISRNKFKTFADRIPDDKELEKLFIEFLKAKFDY